MENLRLLVVDDTALYRKLIADLADEIPGVETVGSAPNGKIALDKVKSLRPDIISLDLEMPGMDGLEVLQHLQGWKPAPIVIMVSSHTKQGADVTMKALDLGAFDFVCKPTGKNAAESRKDLDRQLRPIMAAVRARNGISSKGSPAFVGAQASVKSMSVDDINQRMKKITNATQPDIVAIGISTGGPRALGELIPVLPKSLKAPIAIVQHIPAEFSAALAESLNKKSALTVVEAKDGQILEKGTVYIAPGGKQMKIVPVNGSDEKCFMITDDPPENNCKPSVDYLFRSVAKLYQKNCLGIIMTGMGADGVLGLRLMKRHGVTVIAQDQQSCTVFGMPAEAIKAGVVDVIAPLDHIANEIITRVKS